jgi:hypothetical protein
VARALAHDAAVHRGPALSLHELIPKDGIASEDFGASIAITDDTLVIGALSEVNSDSGAVYLFHRPVAGWAHVRQVATLVPSTGAVNEQFGSGVAISGRTIVASAPYLTVGSNQYQCAVYVFDEPKAGWNGTIHESAELIASNGGYDSYLGYEGVAVSGRTVTAGAGYQTIDSKADQGAVYVWAEPKTGWSGMQHQSAELTASDGAASDYLGYGPVGFSGTAVVAAGSYHRVGSHSDQGAIYIWARPKAGWSGMRHESAQLTPAMARG